MKRSTFFKALGLVAITPKIITEVHKQIDLDDVTWHNVTYSSHLRDHWTLNHGGDITDNLIRSTFEEVGLTMSKKINEQLFNSLM